MSTVGHKAASCGCSAKPVWRRRLRFRSWGVVADGPLKQFQQEAPRGLCETVLEPHHTYFVIVPGDDWGAESPWIARTATVLAGAAPSITGLVNGGQIAYADVQRMLYRNEPPSLRHRRFRAHRRCVRPRAGRCTC